MSQRGISIETSVVQHPNPSEQKEGDPQWWVLLQLPNGYAVVKPADARAIATRITLAAETADMKERSK